MLKVSTSLPDIAVLRGGAKDFTISLQEGVEILQSLTKLDYHPLDVLIDKEGNWTLHGQPTDAHFVFSKAHTIVDATHMKGQAYQSLANRMGIPLLFSKDDKVCMDREDMYRILRQQGFQVPDTAVIRSKAPIKNEQLHSIWRKYQTPLMLRPLVKREEAPSKLINSFHDLEKIVADYYNKGVDMHVLTYKKVPTSSVTVIPNFRGEKLYIPLWTETFTGEKGIPDENCRIEAYTNASEEKKKEMNDFIKKVYNALDLNTPTCIDVILGKDGYVVVNVETTPSLRKDGRFMKSLETTGADAGHYVHSFITSQVLGEKV
jgi:D-alanine-D-alanine ligase-like ATP-grasp enzyme